MEKRSRRVFTPEQKFAILKDIELCPTVKEGLEKHQLGHSVYQKWKRQLAVGGPPCETANPSKPRTFAAWRSKTRSSRRSS